MDDNAQIIKDKLAVITAEIDQAQATLDEARSRFRNQTAFQLHLDDFQIALDIRRAQVEIMGVINGVIEP